MSMSVLVQLGVGMATPVSILQAKKHLTRNMEQNADIEKCKPSGSLQRHGEKGDQLSPWKTRAQNDSLFAKGSEGVCDFRI